MNDVLLAIVIKIVSDCHHWMGPRQWATIVKTELCSQYKLSPSLACNF